ncbi:double-strand break repair protein AddB [Labrys miyagiensis]|uniref:Double-strand break repair protein AddB n=1 Tax=Labrys miyagiensis TaxID=346912 RepID=A0ABQ6CY39_9HYPH|nr:double-strand break repair protein AddB [Labrys miyagiensis]GLS23187.1 double-strand break repair protein AddB [Labrys miyagiensis]
MAHRPNLLTIAPGSPFLETLVDALLDGRLVPGFAPRHDPLALAGATIYLPTRRAIRALRGIFLDRLGTDAALLPRLMALGEIDDDEVAFAGSAPDMPEPVAALSRQIVLTRLILQWSAALKQALLPIPGEETAEPLLIPSSPGDAAGLAAELGRFLDGLQIDRVPPQAIAHLGDSHAGLYDRYWDITQRFLEIATVAWPGHLKEIGKGDAVWLRNARLEAQARRLAETPQSGPVIVAGSTGSIPATRDLIKAVAVHPQGAVVLPGLDLDLDAAGWQAITRGEGEPSHPQAGLAALLAAIGVGRDGVTLVAAPPAPLALRAALASQALRPAETTDLWVASRGDDAAASEEAFAGVALIEAAHEGEEALAAALALRETLLTPGRTAALVTPNRQLARRVVTELGRWNIEADDSAGQPLGETPPGLFARLVLDAALHDFDPIALLSLLKHPFARLGQPRAAVRRAAAALEIGALRGPRPAAGLAGLSAALALCRASLADPHCPAARLALGEEDWAGAEALVEAFTARLEPFAALLRRKEALPAATFFAAHREAVEALAAPEERGEVALHEGEAGEALQGFFTDLATVGPGELALPPFEYPGLFAALMAGRSVRGGEPKHPRISIYGLLEARLLPVDRLVLAGLDESVWPPDVKSDPWLNRPMRAAIGLSSLDKRIGLAAHDFEQALGYGDVVVTRALKRGGSPTVPSRWLQRLGAFLGPAFDTIHQRGERYCALARLVDHTEAPPPELKAPRPTPPLALRPTRLSVTQIEHLVRDPYTIYARHILGLEPLDEIAMPPGAADRGTLIHAALERFAELCADGVPPDALARFHAIGDELFAGLADFPEVLAFWRPRFAAIAAFLVEWERERRPHLASVRSEVRGRLTWPTRADRAFTLAARADRIEAGLDGRVSVLDFKTGQAPTARQVQSGLNPQLALEMAILMEAGFTGVPAPDVLGSPSIVHLAGGARGPSEKRLEFKDVTPLDVAQTSLASLKALIDKFEKEETPYKSLVHPMFKGRRYGDYDHLARVREWSISAEGEE